MKILRNILIAAVALFSATVVTWASEPAVRSGKKNVQPAKSELCVRLEALPGVVSVDRIATDRFAERYRVKVTQPVDHKDPSKGTFTQRFYVSHAGFDRPTLIVAEGYSAKYGEVARHREEISERFNTNQIIVEHRFFEESTPDPCDWTYMTGEQEAADLHAVNTLMRTIYPGKWISSGISKGGQNTMIYRAFYPDDVDFSVPYVGPVCFDVEDGRHEPFISEIGDDDHKAKTRAVQREVLRRRAVMTPMLEAFIAEKGYDASVLSADSLLDFCVLEYPFALNQWGTPVADVDENTPDSVLFAHFIRVSGPDYFIVPSTTPFFVQAARELGYYGYDTSYLQDMLVVKDTRGYLHDLFLPEDAKDMEFDDTLHLLLYRFLKDNDPKMLFVYGGNDPWTAVAPEDYLFYDKKNMHKFVQAGGSHATRINTMPEEQRERAWAILESWLEE
ncbi:MAG: aminopeptidase [Rikenellaceae bacterium]|nr:aminopeptidase [Rikenellaceae bacterium]